MFLAHPTTFMPPSVNLLAIASPNPEEAPVTRATRPTQRSIAKFVDVSGQMLKTLFTDIHCTEHVHLLIH